MLAALRLNHLQLKVLVVIVVIILVPMLITGTLSARWITGRIDDSIEHWIRESAQLDETALADLHKNAGLFANILDDVVSKGELSFQPGKSPIPDNLQPLAKELGITLIQVYGYDDKLMYSSTPVTLTTSWAHGQDTAVVKVEQNQKNLLAAITIVRIPHDQPQHYRLILGTLFDKAFLNRLNRMSGLKTRLFYPREGDFAKAFSEEDRPLKLRLPPSAFDQLNNKQDYYSPVAENGRYWALYSPVVDASGRVEAIMFSGQERAGSAQLLTDQGLLTLAIFLLGTLLATGTGLLLSRIVVRPVEYLHDAVMRVAAQDFRASIPIHSNDELGQLAKAFNTMAGRLREARDEQRRAFQRDKLSALGELSLAMAHEIRNPIGIINTASKLLETTQKISKQTELQRVIREESLRLDHLLKDFQQLARHRSPEFIELDPAEPLEKALQVMLAGRDNITVVRRYTHDNIKIPADPELLRQAWVNLVRNALEAMGPEAGSIEVGSLVKTDAIILYLHDSGPGIPFEQMTRLFEPFYTTKTQGSGLGLTIANTLVEANGAWLELVPGNWRGARFAMEFPSFHEKEE
ncbi:MAG: HAMP domain-containing sensor histidine kinase [Thioalkalispiraceae bacterium]|jgi:signal transduction histidine kinase